MQQKYETFVVQSLSRVQLFATPWTEAHQAPPSMGFSRQEYWSGVPLPSPMTNLDSILKSRDITVPTEVHIVKSMVFLVVTYGCDSRTIKKPVQFSSVQSLSRVPLFATP